MVKYATDFANDKPIETPDMHRTEVNLLAFAALEYLKNTFLDSNDFTTNILKMRSAFLIRLECRGNTMMELNMMAAIAHALTQINCSNVNEKSALMTDIYKLLMPKSKSHLQLLGLCLPISSPEQQDVFKSITDFCLRNCKELGVILNESIPLEEEKSGEPMELAIIDVQSNVMEFAEECTVSMDLDILIDESDLRTHFSTYGEIAEIQKKSNRGTLTTE